ncbi:unnamed protein product [Didymodactylos carnosus]|uniref:Uncharacterized protein n=2 Tax=Didymodactylos carnosus TaxID=1234261 RepID=A0A815RBS5_9BILA|nr:unnamed protein product [Didymodactylos carnosus]CAF4341413.1 unnamed protein product [Didymodactylos carnosus]
MGAVRVVASQQKLSPNNAIAEFFKPENKENALQLMFQLLFKYIQDCCDEYCGTCYDVYVVPRVTIDEALDLQNGNHYVFSHFNQMFEQSRAEKASGPKHLGCLSICSVKHYMPLLFPVILEQYTPVSMGGSTTSRDGNFSEAEKNIVRHLLQSIVQKAIDFLNTNEQKKLFEMPFVCKEDDSCDEKWDLSSFTTDQQTLAIENMNKFWTEHRAQQQKTE